MNQKEPKYYENLLNQERPLTEDEVENNLAEVSSILLGLEKGLKMLQEMNRKPDPKVMENQKRFDEIKRRLLALVK
jgi:predicted nuclease with TOPRIM domain